MGTRDGHRRWAGVRGAEPVPHRGLLETGEQVSKKAAAALVAQSVPAWMDVVLWARDWWYEGGSDDEPPRTVEVRRFVDETSARLG
ncbi:aminoglycoside adenylyltransferase domain-containing protein [Lapillicoccus sp.]|uniref:aminoglycoside adenylyltransferase domain-containing protein n=1 Tax=Lapillicoccus sp. TaxID=1909287 RepID=UPI00344BFD8C